MLVLMFVELVVLAGCTGIGVTRDETESKIGFDLSRLNNDGLQGPTDGLRALHYEFCIPADETFAEEVQRIDSTCQVMKSANGRVRCGQDEYLCLGNTHQTDFRSVLMRLAELEYVGQIEESFFEN